MKMGKVQKRFLPAVVKEQIKAQRSAAARLGWARRRVEMASRSTGPVVAPLAPEQHFDSPEVRHLGQMERGPGSAPGAYTREWGPR